MSTYEINWWNVILGALTVLLLICIPVAYYIGTQNTGCSHATYVDRPCPICEIPDCICAECPACPTPVIDLDGRKSCISTDGGTTYRCPK